METEDTRLLSPLAPVEFRPIGVVRSPHMDPAAVPIQPSFAQGFEGRAEILPEFEEALQHLEGFSHIHLLYHMHKAGPTRLLVKPFLEDVERGLFATRAPCRPNPIGLSIVRLVKREGATLYLDDVDILDGTPVLDIKPFVARFDNRLDARSGWQDQIDAETAMRRGRRSEPR